MSTHRHSRNKGLYKVVICSTVSTHAKVAGDIILCRVPCGSLGQEVKDAYLMAIERQLPLRTYIQYKHLELIHLRSRDPVRCINT